MAEKIHRNRSTIITGVIILLALLVAHYLRTGGKFHVFEYLLLLIPFFAGLFFLHRALLFYLKETTASVTILVLVLSTNLFWHTGVEFTLQPVLIFTLYAVVIYFTASGNRSPRIYKTILLAVFIGLTALVQGTGYLILLVPFFWGVHDGKSFQERFTGIIKNQRTTLIFLASLLIIFVVPMVTLKITPGNISFLDFRVPGLFTLNFRHFWYDLFSIDHGWLIWSPVVFLFIVGFYFLAEKNREIFYPLFLMLLFGILFEACWTKLGTKGVFGQVAFIQLLAVLAFPLGFLLEFIFRKGWIPVVLTSLVLSFFIFLNVFQTWQYTAGVLPKSGMTGELYCRFFGTTEISEVEKLTLEGVEPDPSLVLKDSSKFVRRTLAFYDFNTDKILYEKKEIPTYEIAGRRAYKMDSTNWFSPAVKPLYSELTKKRQAGARMSAWVYVPEHSTFSGAALVITSVHQQISYRYRQLSLGDLKLPAGKWEFVSLDYLSPVDPYPGDRIDLHIWYTGKSAFYIDDLKFELFEPKD